MITVTLSLSLSTRPTQAGSEGHISLGLLRVVEGNPFIDTLVVMAPGGMLLFSKTDEKHSV